MQIYSASLQLLHSFALSDSNEFSYAQRVRVSSEDEIVVARDSTVAPVDGA